MNVHHLNQNAETYSEKDVLQVYRWAYILPRAISHHPHSNNQVNSPIYCCGADQQILLPPVAAEENAELWYCRLKINHIQRPTKSIHVNLVICIKNT